MSEKVIKVDVLVKTINRTDNLKDVWDVCLVDDEKESPIGIIKLNKDNNQYEYYEGCNIRDSRWASLMSKINQRQKVGN